MKLLVSCIPFDRGRSGISVYMRNVVRELAAAGHDLTLLVEPGDAQFFPEYRTVEMPGWTRKPLISMFHHLFVLPRLVKKIGCDGCLIAAANRRTFAWYPVPTAAVVHDLAQYHVTAKYDRFRMFYLKHLLPFFIRRAPHVVAISHSTAADLTRYWRVKPERIATIYNGLSLHPQQRSGWLAANALTAGNYLLYISRIEHPGKNHRNLILAFDALPDEVVGSCRLVLAGADWHGAAEVRRTAEQARRRAQILFTGFLDNADLAEAYGNAAGYLFPSHFEGFGLSLIEAMHYRVPCACSNNSSLGEIGAGAALLFDPASPEEIAAAIRRLLTEPALCAELRAAGERRAAEFDWAQHARQLTELYEKQS